MLLPTRTADALGHLERVLAARPDDTEALGLAASAAERSGDPRGPGWRRLHEALTGAAPQEAPRAAPAETTGPLAEPAAVPLEPEASLDWDLFLREVLSDPGKERPVTLADVAAARRSWPGRAPASSGLPSWPSGSTTCSTCGWAAASRTCTGCSRRAIALRPDWASPHLLLSLALSRQAEILRRGRALQEAQAAVAAAREAVRLAVTLEPWDEDTWVSLGFVLLRQRKWAQAEAACRRALAIDPNDAGALNNLPFMPLVATGPAYSCTS